MTDMEMITKYYKPLTERMNRIEAKLDSFITMLNDERKAETSENDAAIIELAELVSEKEVE